VDASIQDFEESRRMASAALEITIILLLIVANGVLAMAEIAIVSARKARLQQRAEAGDRGACVALELSESLDDFLSTVQIGITLIGVLAGAFGGATIASQVAAVLGRVPALTPYSDAISVALVVVVITYLSLVIGELAPKRFALDNAERIASRIAPPMRTLSRILSPIARFLSISAEAVLRVLGRRRTSELPVTEEEIRIMLEEGTRVGVFDPLEEEMVEHVFRLGDRKVSALLTPRIEIVWIDVDDPSEEIEQKVVSSGYSRFPVARGSLDDVLGVVLAKDLLVQNLAGQPIDVQAALRPAPFVPESIPALEVLDHFKEARAKIALVLDEYGGLQGLVTTADILEAIVGEIPGLGEFDRPEAFRREDGSWLLDGMLPLDEFAEIFGLKDLPAKGTETLGGLVMTILGRIPSAGDRFQWGGLRFEVMDMDELRVDKVLVMSQEPASPDRAAC
jgi:putative hemolysin